MQHDADKRTEIELNMFHPFKNGLLANTRHWELTNQLSKTHEMTA